MDLIQITAEILLVFACICALFSDQIESHFKTNGQLKRVILIFSSAVSILSIVTLVILAYA